MTDEAPDAETAADYRGPKGQALVKRWTDELDKAEKREKDWRNRGKEVIKRYRDEEDADNGFALLWSNVETLKPALMNKTPVPDIRRRHADRTPVARVASEIAERAVSTNMELVDFDHAVQMARDDRLLVGRGQCWIRYEAEMGEGADEMGQPMEVVVSETAPLDHVQWEDFLHGYARSWKHVPWVARRSRMTRGQLKKRFGAKIGGAVELHDEDEDKSKDDTFRKGEVWEIWDKESKSVYWICKSYKSGPLEVKPDFLNLKGFFPCPRPLYASTTPSSLIPIIDYCQYQDQALEIDTLTSRIGLITEAIRVRGVFDAAVPELGQILDSADDNRLIPSVNFANLLSKGGMKGAIEWMPVDQLAQVLQILVEQRNILLQQVYEITGIADIIRGASQASETYGAQRIKANFATLRLNEMQREVARFCRDCIRLMAEVIVEQFSDDTLLQMSAANDISEVAAERQKFEQAQAKYQQDMAAFQKQMMAQMMPGQMAGGSGLQVSSPASGMPLPSPTGMMQ